ncbi:MFS transporter [Actinomycetospora sp. TBRC 11914]|uniref:MFS transporter n=1 Tax=Actinomycetospora sp. TBRC 11914 TaxID=2729387 RepID=UPI00145C8A28|nr:MFS transporter [Actinomycetospora sp. TBRC 11914]NMO92354.1 MFS transporter [Actinomycetospora sp. TBRC 11914]
MTRRNRGSQGGPDDDRPATFADTLAVAPFRRLWTGQLLSILGDQVARVALTVLVFDRTASAALTALTYALTFLPDLVAGPLLSGLADRFPRRATMVVTDVARAVLVAVMAVPGMPLPALCVLLVAVQMLAAPFLAARSAILPHLLEGDRYVAGAALIGTTYQSAQVLGFALGGPLVTLLGVSPALGVDAATFVVSAVVVGLGLPEHRAAGPDGVPTTTGAGAREALARIAQGARVVGRDARLRALIALACVSAFVVTVEGLAAPYAAHLGAGTAAVGLLLAANPLGAAVGIVALTRLVAPEVRPRLLGPLAVGSCVPLIGSALDPPLPVVIGLWVVSGLCCAYQVPANAAFVAAVADAHRGQAFGLAVTALRATQGVGVLVSGVLAQATSPPGAVALSGAVGVVAALAAGLAWRRARVGSGADTGGSGGTREPPGSPGSPGPTAGTPDAA